MNSQILVTGGTGLVGGHLILELLNQGKNVHALVRKGGNPEKVFQVWKYYHQNPSELFRRVNWIEIDLNDPAELAEIIEENCQVYHCAGQVSFQTRNLDMVYENNVSVTRNILNVSIEKKIHKLIHVSSIAAIGNSENTEIELNETAAFSHRKKRSYSDSKNQAELEVWRAMAEGLNALIVNPSIILGPGYWSSGSPRIFDAVYKGLKFYTQGVSGYVDARDVAKAMVKLMNSDISGDRFILNAANLSFEELFNKIATALGVSPPKYHVAHLLTELAWRIEALKSFFSGGEAKITKQSARSAHKISRYSSVKIQKSLEFEFTDIDFTISNVAEHYLNNR